MVCLQFDDQNRWNNLHKFSVQALHEVVMLVEVMVVAVTVYKILRDVVVSVGGFCSQVWILYDV